MRSNGSTMRGPSGYAVDTIEVNFHGNNTTHLDALSHFIFNGHTYNGVPASEITSWGAEKNDVMPFKDGFMTRGVLIDWPRFKNVPYMGDDEAIYAEDLDAWEKKTGVRIESGDCVLLRTGRWKRVAEKGPLDLNVKAPGLYASCAKWLKERDIALFGSDVVQDVRPSRVEGVNQPIHQFSSSPWARRSSTTATWRQQPNRRRNLRSLHVLDDRRAFARSRRDRGAIQSSGHFLNPNDDSRRHLPGPSSEVLSRSCRFGPRPMSTLRSSCMRSSARFAMVRMRLGRIGPRGWLAIDACARVRRQKLQMPFTTARPAECLPFLCRKISCRRWRITSDL